MKTNEFKLLYAALMILEFAYESNEDNLFNVRRALFDYFANTEEPNTEEQAGADFLEKLPFPKGYLPEKVVHVIQMLATYSMNPNEFLKKKIYAGVDSIICMCMLDNLSLEIATDLQMKIVAQVNKYFEAVCYESN